MPPLPLRASQPPQPSRAEGRWPEQYKRVKRLFERVRSIHYGRSIHIAQAYLQEHGNANWWGWGTHSDVGQHYRDEIYSFFIHCYHLKDWIKKDPEFTPALMVENYINSRPSLQICADLANGSKHLEFTPREGGLSATTGLSSYIHRDDIFSLHIEIQTSAGPRQAFDVAQECVKDWENYIELFLLHPLAVVDKREADRVFGHFERNRRSSFPFDVT